MNPSLVLDVIKFELRRSLTKGRIAVWLILVFFPIVLIASNMVLSGGGDAQDLGAWLFRLVPQVSCLLGLLLWATPAISTEIEGQTWIYLAMRQSGRSIVLLGKYLTAIIWTLSAAVTAITLSMLIIESRASFDLWILMCMLSTFTCFAYGALYILIGLLFVKRTMVTAVFYTLIVEIGISNVPALANKLTISYRLKGILANWVDWNVYETNIANQLGNDPSIVHVVVLLIFTIALLIASLFRLAYAQFPTQQEG